MSRHDHVAHGCRHDHLGYCAHCDVVYCKDCNKEWGKKEYIYWPYYTYTYPYTQPYWSQYQTVSNTNTKTITGSTTAAKVGEQITYTNHSNCGG